MFKDFTDSKQQNFYPDFNYWYHAGRGTNRTQVFSGDLIHVIYFPPCLTREITCVNFCCFPAHLVPSEKESTLQENNLLLGSIFFPFKVDPPSALSEGM